MTGHAYCLRKERTPNVSFNLCLGKSSNCCTVPPSGDAWTTTKHVQESLKRRVLCSAAFKVGRERLGLKREGKVGRCLNCGVSRQCHPLYHKLFVTLLVALLQVASPASSLFSDILYEHLQCHKGLLGTGNTNRIRHSPCLQTAYSLMKGVYMLISKRSETLTLL